MDCLTLVITLCRSLGTDWSVEKPSSRASNSEMRRWIMNGSVEINGVADRDPKEVIDYPVLSIILHPQSKKRRNTLRWSYGV